MIEQIIVYMLFILGVRSPHTHSNVLGDDIQVHTSSTQFGSFSQIATLSGAVDNGQGEDIYTIQKRSYDAHESARIKANQAHQADVSALRETLSIPMNIMRKDRNLYANRVKNEITQENKSFLSLIQAGIAQTDIAAQMHSRDLNSTLATFTDAKKKEKVISVQSGMISLIKKRIEAMSKQVATISEIMGVAKSDIIEFSEERRTNEFDVSLNIALNAVIAVKEDLIVLSNRQYLIPVEKEAVIKSGMLRTWEDVEAALKYSQNSLSIARDAVMSVVQQRANVLNEPIPKKPLR